MSKLEKYQAYELVNLESRTILNIPAPGAVVYEARDVDPMLAKALKLAKRLQDRDPDWQAAQQFIEEYQ